MVLPSAGRCAGCRARDRLLAQMRQQAAEMQQDYDRLQRRLARLKKDNNRLRAELDELQRGSHRQAGRFRRKKLKKRKKKPGRRRGHAADLRPTPKPEHIDRVVNVPCRLCPDCGVELVDPGQVVQYQTDLPPIVPFVTHLESLGEKVLKIQRLLELCEDRSHHGGRHALDPPEALDD